MESSTISPVDPRIAVVAARRVNDTIDTSSEARQRGNFYFGRVLEPSLAFGTLRDLWSSLQDRELAFDAAQAVLDLRVLVEPALTQSSLCEELLFRLRQPPVIGEETCSLGSAQLLEPSLGVRLRCRKLARRALPGAPHAAPGRFGELLGLATTDADVDEAARRLADLCLTPHPATHLEIPPRLVDSGEATDAVDDLRTRVGRDLGQQGPVLSLEASAAHRGLVRRRRLMRGLGGGGLARARLAAEGPKGLGGLVPPASRDRTQLLSPLQQLVARIVGGLPEAAGFALAGDAALIVRGEIERQTRDLDFFATSPQEVDRVLPGIERALAEGLAVTRHQVARGFARLTVANDGEQTVLDLGTDARLRPPDRGLYGPILAGEELATDNEVLAVFGRAEPRDFTDRLALEPLYGLDHLCELAAQKDGGFRRAVLAKMLGRLDRLPRNEFDIDDREFRRLVEAVGSWRRQLMT